MVLHRKKRGRLSRGLVCTLLGAAAGVGMAAVTPATARGGFVVSQAGDQDFQDGEGPVPVWRTRLLGKGEPAPFDGSVYGDDRTPGALGAFEYAHTFDLTGTAAGAKLTVGLIDHDSPQGDRRNTVALYFDGQPQPTDAFRGISSRSEAGSAHVVTVPVPPELLNDGELRVRFETVRPAREFKGNSLQIDFSRLQINESADAPPPVPTPIPLPPGGLAGGLVLLMSAAGAALRRRARSISRPLL